MIAAHSAASPTKPSDQSRARFRYLPSRVAGKRSPNLAAVIYGTILATAGVASMHESESVTSARALSVLLSTGAVIWAARVYAYLLAERLQGKRRMQPEDVRRVGTREWPIFQATLPLSLPLALGALGVLGEDAAFSFATIVGVAMLIGPMAYKHIFRGIAPVPENLAEGVARAFWRAFAIPVVSPSSKTKR